jgi:hypothetical protein
MLPITDPQILNYLHAVGRLWQQHGYRRLYFDQLPTLYGLALMPADPGMPSSVTLHGRPIPPREGTALWTELAYAKLYFDLDDGHFYGKGMNEPEIQTLVVALLAGQPTEQRV